MSIIKLKVVNNNFTVLLSVKNNISVQNLKEKVMWSYIGFKEN